MKRGSGEISLSRDKFWLRDEVKLHEQRSPLTPENAKKLIDLGYEIRVERSTTRCFTDDEYEKVGCVMEKTGGWTTAPLDYTILGLKELPEDGSQLPHRHIYFAHCFKFQTGWADLLTRHSSADTSLLYDLEFLVDEKGRRVCAFGRAAGFVGAAFGVVGWAEREAGLSFQTLHAHKSQAHLVAFVKGKVADAMKKNGGRAPKAIVIGAKGRCGKGAVELCHLAGVQVTEWDMEETSKGGPFPEILEHDIFVNAIYLMPGVKTNPFITIDFINSHPNRQLSILSDVSCDYNNPSNPVPVYSSSTNYEIPFISVKGLTPGSRELNVISIDNLPSSLPLESSTDFSNDLFPHLASYKDNTGVWTRAEATYRTNLKKLETK